MEERWLISSDRENYTMTRTMSPSSASFRLAVSATVHCLTGCGIGEVLGMVIGT